MSDQPSERKVKAPAEREALKAFRKVEAAKAMTEHAKEEKARYENLARLKAERLSREAKEKKE